MPGILKNDTDSRFSRRRLVGSAAALTGSLLVGRTALAQEDDESELIPIQSTELGDIPTTGTVRGGFVGDAPVSSRESTSAQPIALAIEAAGIDAQIEVQQIVDGVMQNPSGPWIVSWYEQTALLGAGGNVVMAGHVDYWNVGPAVFFDLRNLIEGDEVQVFGDGDVAYTYAVETNETYDLEELTSGTITELVGQTEDPKLTLITCGGEFDYASGEYLSRMVVRAGLVE